MNYVIAILVIGFILYMTGWVIYPEVMLVNSLGTEGKFEEANYHAFRVLFSLMLLAICALGIFDKSK